MSMADTPVGARSPPLVTGRMLKEKFPQAHRIMSELHFMKKLNEELYLQLEDVREALNTTAEQFPCASIALAGLRHILDDAPPAITSTTAAPLVAPDDDDAANAFNRTKKRFLQFVDEAVDKAKQTATPSGSAGMHSAEHQYVCLRSKVLASECANRMLTYAKARVQDCREELHTCRRSLLETTASLETVSKERDALRQLVHDLESHKLCVNSAESEGQSKKQPTDDDRRPTQKPATITSKVDDMFADLFGETTGAGSVGCTVDTDCLQQHSVPPQMSSQRPESSSIGALTALLQQVQSEKVAVEKQLCATEALVTSSGLEIEGLRAAVARLEQERKDGIDSADASAKLLDAAVREKNAATAEVQRLAALVRTLDVNRNEFEAVKQQLATSLGNTAAAVERANSLHRKLQLCTAALDAETKAHEQTQREVLALQRMLNSADLQRELSSHETEMGTSSSPPYGPSGDVSIAAGHLQEEQRAEEELYQSRSALRALSAAHADQTLQLGALHRRCTLTGRLLARAVDGAADAQVRQVMWEVFFRKLLPTSLRRRAAIRSPSPISPKSSKRHRETTMDDAATQTLVACYTDAPQCDGNHTELTLSDVSLAMPAQRPGNDHRGGNDVEEHNVTDLLQTLVALKAEKKVLSKTVLELQETLKALTVESLQIGDASVVTTPRSQTESSSARSHSEGDCGNPRLSVDHLQRELGRVLEWRTSVALNGVGGAAAVSGEHMPSPAALASSNCTTAMAKKITDINSANGNKLSRFVALVGRKAASGVATLSSSHRAPAPRDDLMVPRQQLRNVQKLLELQLRENMRLHQLVDDFSKK